LRKAKERNIEVIKVRLLRGLVMRSRRYIAEKYGFRRRTLSKAMADLIEKKLVPTRS
jgi:DNA-binding GntR family transcriptional regulator